MRGRFSRRFVSHVVPARGGFVAAACLALLASFTACGADQGSGVNTDGGAGAAGAGGGGSGGIGGTFGTGNPMIPGLMQLKVTPKTASVMVALDGAPAKQQFRATGVFAGGKERDVTAEVDWHVDYPGRASVDNDKMRGLVSTSASSGGRVTITASSGLMRDTGRLDITLAAALADSNIGPGAMPLPADPKGVIDKAPADEARAPQLVYPADGVLLPPNLFGVEVHFIPKSDADTLFEVGFKSEHLDLRVHTRCQRPAGVNKGCIYAPDSKAWFLLTSSNRGGGPVIVSVRASDDSGTAVGTSGAIEVRFSRDDLLGALYYWTTTGDGNIMRWDFGNKTQTEAEKIVDKTMTGNTCPGCHALSRDGGKMVVSAGGQNDGRLLLFDVGKRTPMQPFPLQQKSQFESWNANGSMFVGIYGDGGLKDLLLFDGSSGMMTGMIDVGEMQADHPDWAANDRVIAFTNVGIHNTDQKSYKGAIAYVERDGQAWSAPKVLIPAESGKNHFYPAIAPTSDFLVYNRSECPNGKERDAACDFDMDPSSKLVGVFLGPNPAPIELAKANAPGVMDAGKTDITNSYPKWSPFVIQLNEEQKLMWLTFTSRRHYGLRGSKILLWMVGVVPATLSAGKDPSFAAFALPFQDLNSNNHIAQWTEKAVTIE